MKSIFDSIPWLAFGWGTINPIIEAFKNNFWSGLFAFIGWGVSVLFIAIASGFIHESIKTIYGRWNGKTYHKTFSRQRY